MNAPQLTTDQLIEAARRLPTIEPVGQLAERDQWVPDDDERMPEDEGESE